MGELTWKGQHEFLPAEEEALEEEEEVDELPPPDVGQLSRLAVAAQEGGARRLVQPGSESDKTQKVAGFALRMTVIEGNALQGEFCDEERVHVANVSREVSVSRVNSHCFGYA